MTFAPNVPQELTARQVQNYLVSWPFLVYLVSIWFILLPKSEKLRHSGLFQHYELVAENPLLKNKLCDFHRRENKSLGLHPSPQAENMLNQKMSFKLHAGESQSCAGLTRMERYGGLVGLRENLNIVIACISYICVHAALSACTSKLECFSGIRLHMLFFFPFISLYFIPTLLSLAEWSSVWSWDVEGWSAPLALRLIWTWVWIQIQNTILIKVSVYKLQIPYIFFDVFN